jgi:hypothetical protein
MTGKLQPSRLAYLNEFVYWNWYLDFSNHVWDTIGNKSSTSQDMTESGNNVWPTPPQGWGVRTIWWNHFCCLNIVCMQEESSEMDNYRGENFKWPISFVRRQTHGSPTDFQALTAPLFFANTGCASSKKCIQSVKAKKSSLITLRPPQFGPLPLA